MTTLVTIAAYRRLTGDNATSDPTVTEKLTDAQQLVEEYLRRPLAHAERTERLRLYRSDELLGGGWLVYPSATPIDAAATTGYTVLGAALAGVTPDDGPWFFGSVDRGAYATVTYTGGWTTETLPLTIAREIARTAKALTTPALASVPAGATLVMVGDVRIAFGADGATGGALDSNSQAELRPYRRRRAS